MDEYKLQECLGHYRLIRSPSEIEVSIADISLNIGWKAQL